MSSADEGRFKGLSHQTLIRARQVGWLRLALSALAMVAALLVARHSWTMPLFLDAESALYDIRQVSTAPQVEQDDRVVIVPYTDETLINTGKRSPLDRAILARALKRIDGMGAKAIGIDILIDQPQPEDPEIIAAFRSMKTPTFLAYASTASAKDKILYVQEEFLKDFQQKIATGNVRPTSIVIHSDEDNVLRKWGEVLRGDPPRIANAMVPEAKAFATYEGSVSYLRPKFVDRPIFASIPIDSFAEDALFASPGAAAMFTSQIKGRYVLIGGNIQDIDLFETPLSRFKGDGESRQTWGVEIFAHMITQALDGRILAPLSTVALWIAAFLVVLAGALTAGTNLSATRSSLALLVQVILLGGLPFWLASQDYDTYGLPAFGWVAAWFFAFAIVSAAARALGSEQRKFAQSALGKYLPRDIAAEILKDPDSLRLHGEKREIFVVFTDLEGFTKLSHAIEPEMVASLLNRYLDSLSEVVLHYGGTIDKFVGDAVVAFWGAPISRADDGERAAQAAIAMHAAGEAFRTSIPEGVPPIGVTRVGLHFGEAVVGNFGGEGRIQYTALGDSMNTASRLESANKQTKSCILVSEEAVSRSGLDVFRPMGRIVLRGRAKPISVYEPVPTWTEKARKSYTELANRAISGDVSAITTLRESSAKSPQDAALANFVYRLEHQETGGYFVLD